MLAKLPVSIKIHAETITDTQSLALDCVIRTAYLDEYIRMTLNHI